nr:membrane-bound lytic murein transglycosylase MltF [Desulfobotulus pelophilus]
MFLFTTRCIIEFTIICCLCLGVRLAIHLADLPKDPELPFPLILERGELPIVTRNALHTYYFYNEEPMGFEYELVKTLADKLELTLTVTIVEDLASMEAYLAEGKAAIAIPGSPAAEKALSRATNPYMHMEYTIIVHRSNLSIRSLADMAGMKVHIPAGSDARHLLWDLQEDGFPIEIIEQNECGEELFHKVALREIDITIIPGHMARRYQRYYPQAVPAFSLGKPAPFAWLVHPQAHKLRYTINLFFDQIQKDGTFETLYAHHYGDLDLFDYVDLMRFHRRLESRLPRYQELFETYAEKYGFDWRLIVAQAYQESHLNPWARSHADARGLMQLMARTARSLGVTNIHDPAQNIEAGIRYLKKLHDLFSQAEEPHRTYIALGAYNVGQGHMFDARNLARQFNLDPNRWYNMEKTLPLLEQKKYYKDATYGYSRGSEPVKYLRKILLYYDILRHKSLLESRNLPPE